MGRKRTIDRNVTMEAIEAVVREHGVAGLSIDAVSRAAGISKSSVVYDFETKDALLAAFIRLRMDKNNAEIDEAATRYEGQPNALLRGMLDVCSNRPSEDDMACAMAITASLANGNTCRELMGGMFANHLEQVDAEACDPARARLAWLALHGVMSLEYLRFYDFPPDERQKILADITAILSPPSDPT